MILNLGWQYSYLVMFEFSHVHTAPHKDSPADVRMAWEFCKERSKSIEVCYENQQGEKILTRVHFKFEKQVS